MVNRAILVIVGSVLLILGSVGIVVYQTELKRQAEESRARAIEEERKSEEARANVEELNRLLEEERQKTLDAQLKAEQSESLRERELQKREQEIETLAKKLAEERSQNRRNAEQRARSQGSVNSGRHTAPSRERMADTSTEQGEPTSILKEGHGGRKTVTVRVQLDGRRWKDTPIAHVHIGDQVSVKVRRSEGADQNLHIGLAPLDVVADASPDSYERFVTAPRPVVSTPIDDIDRLSVTPPRKLGGNDINSKDGAILTIGVGSRPDGHGGRRRFANGIYEVELTIETGNRWGIRPRSLL